MNLNLSRPFIRRPVASALIALGVVLLGALAYGLLPVAPLPQVDFPTIQVYAQLPGASPETMASSVATPLERALGSIAGVTAIRSNSTQGSTGITLEFDFDRDIDAAARDVQAAINAARGQLPSGMPRNPSYRKVNPSSAPIMALALSSPNLAPGELYDVASTVLAQKLSQVTGVGEVQVWGSALPAVRVQLNPNALAHYGIALDEVRQAIAQTNSLRPRGLIEHGDRHWQVQVSGQLRKAAEYRSLIVRYRDGAPVRLSDVAAVTDSVENRYASGFHNDRAAVLLMVRRQPGANIAATIDAINAQLPGLRALVPADADLALVMDRSPGIRATLREARFTLMLAATLVMLVVLAFLGSPRAALIPSLAIPVSLIATFAIMYLYGFSLNNLSLMALIVAAGLVVDDAIVVLENISRHIERGLSPVRAALKGAGEVGFTLLAMTLSLVTVFVSILFMGGLVERLFREFSITLAAAMLVSLAVSLTLTPSLCSRWLKAKDAAGSRDGAPSRPPGVAGLGEPGAGVRDPGYTSRHRFSLRHYSEASFDAVRRGYARGLTWVLRHPTLMLLIFGGTIALNVALYITIPKGFLPEQDTGQLNGWVRGDDGFSFQIMQPKIETFRQLLLKDPAVADVVGMSGGGSGTSNGWMMIRLKPLSERGEPASEVVNRLRLKVPPVAGGMMWLSVSQDIQMPRTSDAGSYDFTLLSDDLALLRKWAPKVATAMQSLPELTDVDGPTDEGAKQVMLTVDREAARRLGVDMQMVTQVLNNSFSQRQISTIYDHLNQYRVVMELDPIYTEDPVVLDQVQVIGTNGQRVPLSAFTRYEFSLVNDRVGHREQFASENVGFSLAPGVSLEQGLAAIDRAMAQIMLPNEIQGTLAGNAQTFQQSLKRQPLLILVVLVAVYLVLGILYESTVHPLTILSTLPSAGLGALLALRLTGTEFTLIALLGLFLLIGIVMKNAILMIDFALAAERKHGWAPRRAIFEAAQLRLRPILMTNLCALLGSLPLVFATGEGVEMRRPLGLAIAGGLVVSQLLTLFTVPVIYLALDRLRVKVVNAFRSRFRARPAAIRPASAAEPSVTGS
ncbi:efflux RND transporter permease subunit [Opitutus terrae]|uniref:Acriflavin resistance protein n=1 Tax=Opitutus terrae (strain DSM 11246 / JCM 15787 / PB90-1) TaxID=452637 RepID=B1ZNH6_OPITP|nr:efflux RND transporter permease subunit [Opitutus terrae]ACB74410.1 acriflavin resistance protein [Opitutus terrae PB90-1]